MKKIIRDLTLLSLILVIFLMVIAIPQPTSDIQAIASELPEVVEKSCPEFGAKIDLNNANIIAFQDCRGFSQI